MIRNEHSSDASTAAARRAAGQAEEVKQADQVDQAGASPAESENLRRFPCGQCGAKLEFKPGSEALVCPYCGHENRIERGAAPVEEQDYSAALGDLAGHAPTQECTRVKCDACAAEVDRPANVTALRCPFCGSNIVATAVARRLITPAAVLPFKIARDAALELFRTWLRRRWFAPSALRRLSGIEQRLSGVYLPFWTYDAHATSRYAGQRGDDYWVTENYTTTENGQTVTRTRQVVRTRWTPVSGVVENDFDDLLVCASRSLPRGLIDALEPWDLAALAPYQDDYLSGFSAESYQIDLPGGFAVARGMMEGPIRATIRADIGGDHQQIGSVQTHCSDITFKHILLPVWVSAYRFKRRVFRFVVNARTGEVHGERPYSWVKITSLVLTLIAAGLLVWWLIARGQ